MPYVITDACVDVKDKSCIEECPVDCIYEGARMLYINGSECIDCGACEPACPTDAIYYEDDLPESKNEFKLINKEFFDTMGNIGGASNYKGELYDHPKIKDI